jgi:acetyl esterase
VRIYRPGPDTADRPAIVFFHGGGFVICSLDTHDAICRELAVGVDAVVINVDYRLAPETRWPGAAQDCYAATAWVAENAAELGIDPARIVVAGDSAGGNLAAVVTLLARDLCGPELAGQLLVYPMLDTDFDTESYRRNGLGYNVTVDHLRWYWQQYLGDHDGTDPAAAPLLAPDLRDLPPAYIVMAEYCPLRTENEQYAARLTAAGVPATLVGYPGVAHGFFTLGHLLDTGRRAVVETTTALREMLHG